MYTDPSGEIVWLAFAVYGAWVMGVKAGIAAERAGGHFWKDGFWKGALVGFAAGALGGSGLAPFGTHWLGTTAWGAMMGAGTQAGTIWAMGGKDYSKIWQGALLGGAMGFMASEHFGNLAAGKGFVSNEMAEFNSLFTPFDRNGLLASNDPVTVRKWLDPVYCYGKDLRVINAVRRAQGEAGMFIFHSASIAYSVATLGSAAMAFRGLARLATRQITKRIPHTIEGIYEFTAASGKTYIGQSGNIPLRLQQHISSGKLLPGTSVSTTEVLGGKLAREIAEQLQINKLGGIRFLENIRNPIGPSRIHLLP